MGVGRGVDRQEAAPGGVGVGHHLEHHLVARGDQRPRPRRPTEAAQPLAAGVPAVHVHVVIATQVVTLQVDEAEGEDDHPANGDLEGGVTMLSLILPGGRSYHAVNHPTRHLDRYLVGGGAWTTPHTGPTSPWTTPDL